MNLPDIFRCQKSLILHLPAILEKSSLTPQGTACAREFWPAADLC
ncbi:hypothetical protein [Acidisoma silvae]|nr:hypothetical protein [Acidisoma silvae]